MIRYIHFTRGDLQTAMANKHMKTCSADLANGEMQMKLQRETTTADQNGYHEN